MRALVVDGNRMVTELLSSFMGLLGCAVDEACDGREAVMHLLTNSYDMLITDSELVSIDGPELCKFVKARFQGIYVIGMSGYLSALDDLKNAGADACLAKPFDLALRRTLLEGRCPALHGDTLQ